MRHGSFFSGIGGFDLAADWMDWDNVFHCEINKFSQEVLKKHWPKAITYGDIKKTNFTFHRGNIDIITGGFPCQPYSVVGDQRGEADERHLWPEMLRAIKEIQPSWVVGENVSGIITQGNGIAFERICQDLENEGYEVQPFIIPATAVGAKHIRSRVWIVAYSSIFANAKKDQGTCAKRSTGDTRDNDSRGNRSQIPSFEGSLSAPRVLRAINGIPNGVDRNKSLGNAIIPKIAYKIFKTIEQYEQWN